MYREPACRQAGLVSRIVTYKNIKNSKKTLQNKGFLRISGAFSSYYFLYFSLLYAISYLLLVVNVVEL